MYDLFILLTRDHDNRYPVVFFLEKGEELEAVYIRERIVQQHNLKLRTPDLFDSSLKILFDQDTVSAQSSTTRMWTG